MRYGSDSLVCIGLDIIECEGSMNAFKKMCKSRLTLQSIDIETTLEDDNDFVAAISRLFAEQGGTPEQFSKALAENLQSEKINVQLTKGNITYKPSK